MIDKDDVALILADHDRFVRDQHPKWKRIDAAYCDDFWSGLPLDISPAGASPVTNLRQTIAMTGTGKVRPQINLVKPWVTSVMAALPYTGDFTCTPQRVGRDDPSPEQIEAMGVLVTSFYEREEISAASEQGLQTSLMLDGGGAFKVGIDLDDPSDDPVDAVYLEVVQPYEYVVDRRALSIDRVRYAAHVYYLTQEEYKSRFKAEVPDADLTQLPDVLKKGPDPLSQETTYKLPKDHVRICEFYDLTERPAALRFFRVSATPASEAASIEEIKLKAKLEVLTWKNKRPAVPLRPVVIDNPNNKRLFNVAPVNATYELNSELNSICADMATAYRRDWARIGVYDPTHVSDEMQAAIKSGVDVVLVPGVKGEEGMPDLSKVFQWVEKQPISSTALEYRKMLNEDSQKVGQTAQFTRGTPGQYLSATEVNALDSYSQASTGRIATRMRETVCGVGRLFLRALLAVMKARDIKSLPVTLASGKEVKLTRELIDREWQIDIVEGSTSPIAGQRRKQEFLVVADKLVALAQAASSQDASPELRRITERILDHFVELWGLPRNLEWENLDGGEKPPPPAPIPAQTGPVQPGPAGAPPPPPDTMGAPQDLSGSPTAQAMAQSVNPT